MLKSSEAEVLLGTLCVDLGFCLPAELWNDIVSNPPTNVDDFVEAVLLAEGLDPLGVDLHTLRQVKSEVAEAFQKHIDKSFFGP